MFIPPRHGKSVFISQYFPAWYLALHPEKRIILISYEADFAASWGRKARDVFERTKDLHRRSIREDVSSSTRWETTYGGGMTTAGIGGPITGKGADVLIIDDPIKNVEEANSRSKREKVWDWFLSTAYTRLEPGGVLILVMSRWHEDDLAGKILKEMKGGGEKWEVLRLPALAEENDPLGRKVGEALWPEKFPTSSLLVIKQTIGSYWFQALYQGNPVPEEGAIFKREWLRFYYAIPTDLEEIVISWDMAFKDASESSYVVGEVWGRKGIQYYLLDLVRGHWDFTETLRICKEIAKKWYNYSRIIIEEKANGVAVLNVLRREIPKVVGYTPTESKESRAYAVTPLWEAGNVLIPDKSIAWWVDDFITELLAFPRGEHDDQVDAMTQALLNFEKRKRIFSPVSLEGESKWLR